MPARLVVVRGLRPPCFRYKRRVNFRLMGRKYTMADTVIEALILDFLEWLASGERGYEEVIDAWAPHARNCRSGKATPSGLAFLGRRSNFQGSVATRNFR
jgi:hypothetical protein